MLADLDTPRLWSKVDTEHPSGCWMWKSATDAAGYGMFWVGGGVTRRAHRIVYEIVVGPIPEGLQLDHLCRTTSCVNPGHLEPVTGRVNVHRSPSMPWAIKARATHCKRAHEFAPENTYVRSHGRRECRKCNADKARDRRLAGTRRSR